MSNEENQNEVLQQTSTDVGAALNAILESIAFEELQLASMITAEANKVLATDANILHLLTINANVEQLLRTIVKKNIVLETKLQDNLDAATALNHSFGVNLAALLPGLVSVLNSIAAEETALGKLIGAEANKINKAITVPGVSTNNLVDINNSVNRTLRTIIKKEIVLETKMQDVLDFIVGHLNT
ncbi:hypothetical protein DFP93_11275 [Aneurinibacillus soli]|uniref:Uncharacterized protein n=1 Tax=Aneurinibacillus soli TaxID=1500254 RepID=A0A0U5B1G3_9BACL|nr:hypothetical protein [Aneurinibacillus soli]PYE60635.1 hypothetical protein DFP93_11275 [Aneurinibacillus soli]BAU29841.1 hypothetical protein CB4_04095 [Aneurinibacillus soli]